MTTKIPDTDFNVPWSQAVWLNPPPQVSEIENDILVSTGAETDFWRITSYNFIHDNGHALLTELSDGRAVEVTFKALFDAQFDQAGLLVYIDEKNWIKAGVELSDGVPQLGAVVTKTMSDWSVAPVPNWNDGSTPVTVRVSRSGNALTIRARLGNNPWQFVRLTPIEENAKITTGPMVCSPTRTGLQVRFTKFALGPADLALHD
ncbi:regulation of enolase protein 1-like isoform X1 [Bradysia coprophila]|uniref:regulation of enolase protein 1-like isoform X1 n=1 Tax=Bradysia coprophila TaxID=38358 RepID=UPI00187D92AC|nr:regulation of enolase protein 1-like isoform X1 [Bradysia coprophila]XP_037045625.1 regulation of enolase protein 1-like isoform X1 [Bradysia coprophila]